MKTSKVLVCTLIAAAAMIPTAYAETVGVIDTTDTNLKAYWNFNTDNNPNVGTGWGELPTWSEDGYGKCTTTTTHPYTTAAGLKAADGFTVSFDINDFGNGTLLSMTTGAMNQTWRSISITATDNVLSAQFLGTPNTAVTTDPLELTDSDWTTVTLVGSASGSTLNLDFYLNGTHLGTSSTANATNITGTNVINNVQFGHFGVSSNSASTNIDNILVYNKALSATDIAKLIVSSSFTWNGGTEETQAWTAKDVWTQGGTAASFTAGSDAVFSTAGASVTIGESESVIAGDVTVSADTTLDVDGELSVVALNVTGGEATVDSVGVLSAESISVAAGATLSLSGTVALENAIANSGTVVLAEDVVFDLDGLEATDGIYTIMNVFTGAIQGTLSYKNFSKGNHRSEVTVWGGLCSYAIGAVYSDMVWAGGETGTWNESDANWTSATEGTGNKIAFANGDSVKFTSNASVSIAGNDIIEVKKLETAKGTITLGENAKLSVEDTYATSQNSTANFVLGAGAVLTFGQTDFQGADNGHETRTIRGTLDSENRISSVVNFDRFNSKNKHDFLFENVRVNIGEGGMGAPGQVAPGTQKFVNVILGSTSANGWSSVWNADSVNNRVPLAFGGTVTVDTAVWDVQENAYSTTSTAGSTITLNGPISDVEGNIGSIVKTGAGTLVLNGANTYSGGTTISGGTVVAQGDSALGAGTVNITAGKLSLGGAAAAKVTNAVTMSSGTTIEIAGSNKVTLGAVGKADDTGGVLNVSAVGTEENPVKLELSGVLELNRFVSTASFISIDFGTVGQINTTGKTSDWGGGVNFKQNSTIELVVSLTDTQSDEYTSTGILSYDRILFTAKDPDTSTDKADKANGLWNIGDSQFLSILLEVAEGRYLDPSLYQGRVDRAEDVEFGRYAHIWMEDTADGTSYLQLVVNIPEPSAFGLLAGVGALALVAARRRRRK